MKLLYVNTFTGGGGAERIALTLHKEALRLGHDSTLAYGKGTSSSAGTVSMDSLHKGGPWYQMCKSVQHYGKAHTFKGSNRLARCFELLTVPSRSFDHFAGREPMAYPATRSLTDWALKNADLVHGHNLHGEYFDLRQIGRLGAKVPLFLTLHDEWTFTGHCAYSFDCQRWKTGCGSCPALDTPPSVMKDATDANWRVKKEVWEKAAIHLITPSSWLMEKAKQSMIWPGVKSWKVIPNGVDLDVYKPTSKVKAREELGLPIEPVILLFVANGLTNPLKDFPTLLGALREVVKWSEERSESVLLVALGSHGSSDGDKIVEGLPCIRAPFEKDPTRVALYYQAADLFVHSARSDNFPTTILEAMATGLPVVASEVGGIPEQIVNGETGFLVGSRDEADMAAAIKKLVGDKHERARMGSESASLAKKSFGQETMAENHLAWYSEILGERSKLDTRSVSLQ